MTTDLLAEYGDALKRKCRMYSVENRIENVRSPFRRIINVWQFDYLISINARYFECSLILHENNIRAFKNNVSKVSSCSSVFEDVITNGVAIIRKNNL